MSKSKDWQKEIRTKRKGENKKRKKRDRWTKGETEAKPMDYNGMQSKHLPFKYTNKEWKSSMGDKF